MAVIYKINSTDRASGTGAVITLHWTAVLQDQEYTASTYSTVSFTPDPDDSGFIAYEDLTEEIVIGWLLDALGEEQVQAIETSLLAQIENQKNPPILRGTPW